MDVFHYSPMACVKFSVTDVNSVSVLPVQHLSFCPYAKGIRYIAQAAKLLYVSDDSNPYLR